MGAGKKLAVLAALATTGLGGVVVIGGAAEQAYLDAKTVSCGVDVVPASQTDSGTVKAAQDRNIATTIARGRAANVPERGVVIAIAVMYVESDALNLPSKAVPESLRYPHDTDPGRYPPDGIPPGDYDSINPFQQRVSMGWFDSVREGMRVDIAADAFFSRLLRVPGWETMPFSAAADAVQISAFPDRYGQREADARAAYARLAGTVPVGPVAAGCEPAVDPVVTAGAWANPLKPSPYIIVSHYGPRNMFGRTFHYGEDLAAPTGTPVNAACDGTIIGAGWVTGGGGNQVLIQCSEPGYTVKLMHNSKILVKVGDKVEAGSSRVALVGSTGNSTGPHSHVQVEKDGTPIPPLPFFEARGAPL